MAGYNDPESGYVQGSSGFFTHLGHITDITNKFDKDDVPATGHVWIYNTTDSVYRSRALLSTDAPTIERNVQTGTSYTAVSGDAGKTIERDNASPNTTTFGTMPAGTVIEICQAGTGTSSIVASGITIQSRGGLLSLAGRWAEARIRYRTTTEAVLSGDLA